MSGLEEENPFETGSSAGGTYVPPSSTAPGTAGGEVDVFAAVAAATPTATAAPSTSSSAGGVGGGGAPTHGSASSTVAVRETEENVFAPAAPAQPAQPEKNPFDPAPAARPAATPGAFPTLSADEAVRRNPDAAAAVPDDVELIDGGDTLSGKCKAAIRNTAARAAANQKTYGLLVMIVAGASLAVFVLSLTFLDNQTRSGTGCSDANCDTANSGQLTNCVQLVVRDSADDDAVSCEDVCTSSVFAPYRPFQFKFVGSAYETAGIGSLWCTFPASNNNWRIAANFGAAVFLSVVTIYKGLVKRTKSAITATMFVSFIFCVASFLMMCSDSDAVRSGSSECGDNFHDIIEEQYWSFFSNIECQMGAYVMICLIDAGMVVIWAAMTYITHHHRRINLERGTWNVQQ